VEEDRRTAGRGGRPCGEELSKDRIRQLFRRYGILFRELLANELPLLQWRLLFRSLRLMELSGEVLSGHFFEGIPGLQFISPEAFRMLQEPLPQDARFWLSAVDPASLCGTPLAPLKASLPPRLASTHLVYEGSSLVLVSAAPAGASISAWNRGPAYPAAPVAVPGPACPGVRSAREDHRGGDQRRARPRQSPRRGTSALRLQSVEDGTGAVEGVLIQG